MKVNKLILLTALLIGSQNLYPAAAPAAGGDPVLDSYYCQVIQNDINGDFPFDHKQKFLQERLVENQAAYAAASASHTRKMNEPAMRLFATEDQLSADEAKSNLKCIELLIDKLNRGDL